MKTSKPDGPPNEVFKGPSILGVPRTPLDNVSEQTKKNLAYFHRPWEAFNKVSWPGLW